jgi:hypothetical protein
LQVLLFCKNTLHAKRAWLFAQMTGNWTSCTRFFSILVLAGYEDTCIRTKGPGTRRHESWGMWSLLEIYCQRRRAGEYPTTMAGQYSRVIESSWTVQVCR